MHIIHPLCFLAEAPGAAPHPLAAQRAAACACMRIALVPYRSRDPGPPPTPHPSPHPNKHPQKIDNNPDMTAPITLNERVVDLETDVFKVRDDY
jgi:hypothetical protein